MSWRTNRKTKQKFRIAKPTSKTLSLETQAFRDAAKSYGLKTLIQSKKLLSLKWRGFPPGEELRSNDRLEYIKNHLSEMPLIVADSKGDIIDGNHRYRVYKEIGLKTVPVLVVSGSEEGLDALEEFSQNWNNSAGWESL